MNSDLFDRELWIIGEKKQLDVSAIWSQFQYMGLPNDMSVSFRSSKINRASIKVTKIEEIIDGAHVQSFEIEGDGCSFMYGQDGGHNYDSVFINAKSAILNSSFCDELLNMTIAGDPSFTQAHLFDANYQHLQNIFDPLQFKALGLSMDDLPMKSNGLPFPLEQKIVDTSQNPGRFILGQGYVEVAAAAMWFGAGFWEKVNNTAQKVVDLLPADVKLTKEVCWKLSAGTDLFTDQTTAKVQDGIRQALFGRIM
ncbi:hypothetical protein [Roseobacter sp. CCS2]|uniref:hypothetical protein n=1 Tax=Roseobacter sp. CCS2 TaxID=391593 RepID=UPI0000F3F0BD|nr:hypothetical protein [Roseobacter sp. CCS2]EBA11193.1 hypothetical protein RCCS2_10490 [Roseobacter sp. CCS2]